MLATIGGVLMSMPNRKTAIKKNIAPGRNIKILITLFLRILFSTIKSTKYKTSALKLHQPRAAILFQKEKTYLSTEIYAKE